MGLSGEAGGYGIATGFGRKGLEAGAQAPARSPGFGGAMPATRQPPMAPLSEDADLAAKRAAFIASERARSDQQAQQIQPAQRAEPVHEAMGVPAAQSAYGNPAEHYPDRRPTTNRPRSLALAYVFWFILGQLSVHRFYLGATQSGIVQVAVLLASLVILFIFPPLGFAGLIGWIVWVFADLFLMPGIHRKFCQEQAWDSRVFA